MDDDPWPYSLGIFDLTDLEWKDEYNAEAEDYQTPEVIRDWYRNGYASLCFQCWIFPMYAVLT